MYKINRIKPISSISRVSPIRSISKVGNLDGISFNDMLFDTINNKNNQIPSAYVLELSTQAKEYLSTGKMPQIEDRFIVGYNENGKKIV
jgi:hypothetical protein